MTTATRGRKRGERGGGAPSFSVNTATSMGAAEEVASFLQQRTNAQQACLFPVVEAAQSCPQFSQLMSTSPYIAAMAFQEGVRSSGVPFHLLGTCFYNVTSNNVEVKDATVQTDPFDLSSATPEDVQRKVMRTAAVEQTTVSSSSTFETHSIAQFPTESLSTKRFADDLHNLWGIVLMQEQYSGKFCILGLLPRVTPTLRTENAEVQAFAKPVYTHLLKLTPGYELLMIEASGSAANASALLEASGYSCNKAWVANSSYAAGGNLWLREVACTAIQDARTKQFVQVPQGSQQVHTVSGVRRISLPYFDKALLGDDCTESMVAEAERQVLCRVEGLLQTGEMKGLLLEKVSCQTGLSLSERFLVCLMQLMDKYKGKLVVDEVMTAGRVGPRFLASLSRGIQPDYITLGKWCQRGLVLRHHRLNNDNTTLCTSGYATENTLGGSIVGCELAFSALHGKLDTRNTGCDTLTKSISTSRTWCTDLLYQAVTPFTPLTSNILQQHRNEAHNRLVFWGEGCIVYANILMPRPSSLRCRFLPLLQHVGKGPPPKHTWRIHGVPAAMCKPCVSAELLNFHRDWMKQMLSEC